MTIARARESWLAPAKINLWLRILGRRDDGYHEVDTALQAIDLADRLTLEPSAAAGLDCRVEGEEAAGVPGGDGNLAARAARLLAERTGHVLRLRLTVTKAVPAGAGLGGGSSDAAATLVALAHRFAVPDPGHTLRGLAAELGADVPFFLAGGTQRARGTGADLSPLAMPAERWGVLVVPPVSVSTAWAYGAWDGSPAPPAGPLAGAPAGPPSPAAGAERSLAEPLPAAWGAIGNDFEPVVFARYPEARRALEILAEGPATVTRLTGSGGGVFALYDSAAVRDADIERVRSAAAGLPGARVRAFALVDHGARTE